MVTLEGSAGVRMRPPRRYGGIAVNIFSSGNIRFVYTCEMTNGVKKALTKIDEHAQFQG